MKKSKFYKILFILLLISFNIWNLNFESQGVRGFSDVIFSFRGFCRVLPVLISFFLIFNEKIHLKHKFQKRFYFLIISFTPSIFIFENANFNYSILRLLELVFVVFCLNFFLNFLKKDFVKLFFRYQFIILLIQPFLGLFFNNIFLSKPDFITGFQLQGLFPVINSNGYATSASIILVYYFTKYDVKNWRIISLLLILMATFSRSTIFSLIVILAIYLISFYKSGYLKVIVIFGIGLISVFSFGYIASIMIRGNEAHFYTLTGRTIFWTEALNYIYSKPFFGNGYASSTRYLLMPSIGHEAASTLHNTWIEILLAGGLISLFFMVYVFLPLKKNFYTNTFWFKSILFLIMIKSFTNTMFMYSDTVLIIYVIYGLSMYGTIKHKNKSHITPIT